MPQLAHRNPFSIDDDDDDDDDDDYSCAPYETLKISNFTQQLSTARSIPPRDLSLREAELADRKPVVELCRCRRRVAHRNRSKPSWRTVTACNGTPQLAHRNLFSIDLDRRLHLRPIRNLKEFQLFPLTFRRAIHSAVEAELAHRNPSSDFVVSAAEPWRTVTARPETRNEDVFV
jgi:hypothetical protein